MLAEEQLGAGQLERPVGEPVEPDCLGEMLGGVSISISVVMVACVEHLSRQGDRDAPQS